MARKAKVDDQTADKQETQDQPVTKTYEQLLAENEQMRQTIEGLSEMQSADPLAMKYMNEMAAIEKTGRVDTDKIKVKEFTDHKNISLWTKWGKRVGPMHRENAKIALKRFFGMGVLLSTKQPTPEEVEAWKKSPEGKTWLAKEEAKREMNLKTLKRGELEKILKAMAQQYGLTMQSLMDIKKANEVMSVESGHRIVESQKG